MDGLLGPLWEGAAAAAAGGESFAKARNISGEGKVRSLRPSATSLAEGGKCGTKDLNNLFYHIYAGIANQR